MKDRPLRRGAGRTLKTNVPLAARFVTEGVFLGDAGPSRTRPDSAIAPRRTEEAGLHVPAILTP